MIVSFKRPQVLGGFTKPIDMVAVPTVGDKVLLFDDESIQSQWCTVIRLEWYPQGVSALRTDNVPQVYLYTMITAGGDL